MSAFLAWRSPQSSPRLVAAVRRKRAGLSLLEVLFAIFIMSIGLMSLVALIPAAKSLILEANRADRATAIGSAAVAEIQNRSFLHYVAGEPWIDANGNNAVDSGEWTDLNGDGVFNPALPNAATPVDTLVMDPWFLARNTTATEVPYTSGAGNQNYFGPAPQIRLQRITPFPQFIGAPAHQSLADRVFSSHDDLNAPIPDRAEARPQIQGYTFGPSSTELNGTTPYQGNYTWLATITPSLTQRYTSYATVPGLRNNFEVAVAVFHKRSSQMITDGSAKVPTERMCHCDFLGSGLGGGDVRLRVPTTAHEDYLKLRPNHWLLLLGAAATGNPADATVTIPGGAGKNRLFARWYRITAIGARYQQTFGGTMHHVRDATLAGRDWPLGTGAQVDTDDDGFGDTNYDSDQDASTGSTVAAFLFDDLIGVYERNVRFDFQKLSTP